MQSLQVDIGRSTSRNLQVRADGVALEWAVCGDPGEGSGCDGCQSAFSMIVNKLESKQIEWFRFGGYIVFAHPANAEDPVEEYLSYILDYEVKKV